MEENPTQKSLKLKIFLAAQAVLSSQEFFFGGITPKPKSRILLDKYCIYNGLPKLQKWAKEWTLSFRG
jgi:hypothetical protein